MRSLTNIQPQPFRFLLYIEWVMLASCGSFAIVEALQEHHLPIQHLLILVTLGIMGLNLPKVRSLKVLYTFIEIGLIFYGTRLGYLHILPTLYLIVLIRSCFLFGFLGRWAIAGVSMLLFLIHQIQYVHSINSIVQPVQQHRFWMHQLSEVLMFGLGLFFVLQLINTLLIERQTQQRLFSAHDQLQQYASQVENLAAVQERNRIARDIHDSLGHVLTALNVQLQTTVKLWRVNPTEAQSFLAQAQRLGQAAIQEVRQSVHALRTDAIAKSLEGVINPLIGDFRQGNNIEVAAQIDVAQTLHTESVKTLYRVVQEALTNIYKHAQATAVQVQISSSSEQVCLTITDNGQGFDRDAVPAGFGLQGMQERVTALRGSFELVTAPNAGCKITVKLPVNSATVNMGVKQIPVVQHPI